jgi:hypothetical protein
MKATQRLQPSVCLRDRNHVMFFSSLKTWVFVTFSFRNKKTLKLHVIQSFPVKLIYKNYTIYDKDFTYFIAYIS